MSRRQFVFEFPDRFVAGTVGLPGQRTFFLQARAGRRIVSVSLEKVQVAVLADRLGKLVEELERRGIAEPAGATPVPDVGPLDEPINEAFRATSLTLGWDGENERFIVEARAIPDEDDPDDASADAFEVAGEPGQSGADGGIDDPSGEGAADARTLAFRIVEAVEDDDDDDALLHVALSAEATRTFVEQAARVVASGRPPCPLCGAPLDATGHICPRGNGHYVN